MISRDVFPKTKCVSDYSTWQKRQVQLMMDGCVCWVSWSELWNEVCWLSDEAWLSRTTFIPKRHPSQKGIGTNGRKTDGRKARNRWVWVIADFMYVLGELAWGVRSLGVFWCSVFQHWFWKSIHLNGGKKTPPRIVFLSRGYVQAQNKQADVGLW